MQLGIYRAPMFTYLRANLSNTLLQDQFGISDNDVVRPVIFVDRKFINSGVNQRWTRRNLDTRTSRKARTNRKNHIGFS